MTILSVRRNDNEGNKDYDFESVIVNYNDIMWNNNNEDIRFTRLCKYFTRLNRQITSQFESEM